MHDKIQVTCTSCSRATLVRALKFGAPALPVGWTRVGVDLMCGDCFGQRYVVRAIWMPVVSVAEGYDPEWSNERCRLGWRALRAALRESWRHAAGVYNLVLALLAASDTAPLLPGPKGPRLPKWSAMPMSELYGLARGRFPSLDSQSLASVIQNARAAYKNSRFARRVLCRQTLPEATAGRLPLPFEEQDSPLIATDGGSLLVRLRVTGQRFTLRLAGGPRHARAQGTLRDVIAGKLVRGQAKILERGAGKANRSGGGEARTNGGGSFRKTEIMFGVTVYMPRTPSIATGDTAMVIRTCAEKLLQIRIGREAEPWSLWDEQVRRRIAAHRAQLERLNCDATMERRLPASNRVGLNDYRAEVCRRHSSWLNDYCHKVAAIIRGLARRRRVKRIEFDCTNKDFVESFPWYKLASMIKDHCQMDGISIDFKGVELQDD